MVAGVLCEAVSQDGVGSSAGGTCRVGEESWGIRRSRTPGLSRLPRSTVGVTGGTGMASMGADAVGMGFAGARTRRIARRADDDTDEVYGGLG